VCPITTGAFLRMQRAVAAAGLARRVAFVEVTVDPWRDSPTRLRAYARLTGAGVPMLTGSVAQIRRFWRFFGIGFERTPQGHPPDRDWWTGRPERFDVAHIDGVFVIDARGYERAFLSGMADVHGRLRASLAQLLSDDGRQNLVHPADPWTPGAVLQDVGRLLGRPIPVAG
jgi:cytochrome oxidase Cu insertion factor (SCO1/SenC/PrrC family)